MRTRGNVKLMTLLAVMLALALVLPAGLSGVPVQACMTQSCWFGGTVTLCGQNVPPGTEITVSLDPVMGPFWTATTFMQEGVSRYWIVIPSDDPGTAERDGGVAGDEVYFSMTSVAFDGAVVSTKLGGPNSSWEMLGHIPHALHLCPFLGDANLDGVIDAGDIMKIQRIIWGLDPPTPTADANNDGVIDAGDIQMITLIINGLADPITCCEAACG